MGNRRRQRASVWVGAAAMVVGMAGACSNGGVVGRGDISGPVALTTSTTNQPAPAQKPAAAPKQASKQWRLTTYYTAVEQYHHGKPVKVKGCPVQDCDHGHVDLGSYPKDFVSAVKDEGTGRITSGPHAGRYLNWSYDVGYWLDTVPANTNGGALVPFHTAAADSGAVRPGTSFTITGCGSQGRDPVEPAACRRFQQTKWVVDDAFTPGLGGAHHVDLYLGEEDRANFTNVSPIYIDATGAALLIG